MLESLVSERWGEWGWAPGPRGVVYYGLYGLIGAVRKRWRQERLRDGIFFTPTGSRIVERDRHPNLGRRSF